MLHTDTTEKVLILLAAAAALGFIITVAYRRVIVRPQLAADQRIDSRYDDYEPYADDMYLDAIRDDAPLPALGHVIPAELKPTGVLRALAAVPPSRTEQIAFTLERDDYLTGRALRILRREREMREGWHWDELTGTWQAGRNLVESLPWDDWLREILEDQVPAA